MLQTQYPSLALPRGRLFSALHGLLAGSGAPVEPEDGEARTLVIERAGWRLLFARPGDVSLLVERGVADYGCTGKDRLLEQPSDVVELLDLGVARCRLVLAVPVDHPAAHAAVNPGRQGTIRSIATKYPRLARRYLEGLRLPAEVVVMHGAVESAPALGLAEAIVDLVQTGATLKANGLVEVDTILESTARLIANPAAYRLRPPAVDEWLRALRRATEGQVHEN